MKFNIITLNKNISLTEMQKDKEIFTNQLDFYAFFIEYELNLEQITNDIFYLGNKI